MLDVQALELAEKNSVQVVDDVKMHTWSVETNHSMAASQNKASEYATYVSSGGRSFRCGWSVNCLASSAAAWASLRLLMAFGSLDSKSFLRHHRSYFAWSKRCQLASILPIKMLLTLWQDSMWRRNIVASATNVCVDPFFLGVTGQ